MDSAVPVSKMTTISDDDFEQLKREAMNDQAMGAMLDVVREFQKAHLRTSLEIRGIYESLLTAGFDSNQAMMLTIAQINK